MQIRIHFTRNNYEDYYDITADTVEDIIEINKNEMLKRGLSTEANNCWSEEIN